ncbi:MAG: sigma-54 dependent transcriptional regulator [Thermodesulfobacteriota bacterium]|nr:sigma-54 dependent transcriptional regulator [Thermodesulfobacteriota bacterium]
MGKKKDKHRYNVSLYILIPIIFSGMSVLTGIIAFQFSKSYPEGIKLSGEVALWAVVIIGITFLCGFAITSLILNPMRKFVEEAEKLPFFTRSLAEKKPLNVNEIDHFSLVFKEITSLLDKVEAKELFPDIIGQSRIMRGLFSQIMKVASTDATVLIMGDSGTGKELVATSIHNHSLRKDKPLVKLSCVAIPEGLLESELFGHEKGAFTGATSQKIGKFELANEGTMLLDEIGDMPMETQAKLLRVLQEREFERVGGTRPIKVDVRFIAASNKDIPEMVREGKFREDLYYRINAFTLTLPPLSERREDIPLLIDYFLEKAPKKARISSDALQIFMNYSWPGNVRELQNTMERAALMTENGIIESANIPASILSNMERVGYGTAKGRELDDIISIDDRLGNLEKKMIVEALISTRGVQARAAEILGIKERSLYHRIEKYGIDISALKP